MKKVFLKLDTDHDGVLTVEEITEGLKLSEAKDLKDIEKIFRSIDTDGGGTINYTEFLAATMDHKHYL